MIQEFVAKNTKTGSYNKSTYCFFSHFQEDILLYFCAMKEKKDRKIER